MRFYVLAAAAALLVIACGELPQAQPVGFGVQQAAVATQPPAAEMSAVALPAAEARDASASAQQAAAAAAAVPGSTQVPAQQAQGGRCGRPGVPPALCPVP